MTDEQAALYHDLLGDVDFETPTPAVVRDGYLAPYQELALFTTPLRSELSWLRERHVRFQEMLDRLMEVSEDWRSRCGSPTGCATAAPARRRSRSPNGCAVSQRSRAPACAVCTRPGCPRPRALRAARASASSRP